MKEQGDNGSVRNQLISLLLYSESLHSMMTTLKPG